MDPSQTIQQDAKKTFLKCGACSHTFFYILNREFGHPEETDELASNTLAGGLMCGQQCGMLWGSALAVGAESYRRHADRGQAIAGAMTTTQQVMESFLKRAHSVNCRQIVGFDFNNPFGMIKFMLTTAFHGGLKNSVCFNLAGNWAPEAIQAAAQGLSMEPTVLAQPPVSCATEVAQKMGASEEDAVTVAGLAGGMGLSGNACGALGAAFWLNTLAWCRKHPGETPASYKNENITGIMKAFNDATGSEILCQKITGRHFQTIDDHTEFIRAGGCDALIKMLAAAAI
ncbi:MAG TPA: C-GCAxxG-C-C family (seleno)protein [Anaerolineales bacterium]|nr:C-GCAxxG-C-C family (seleno)protein [Anaerolineales bacterium]